MRTPDGIRGVLLSMREDTYRDFLCPLIPTVEPAAVIGIRTPELRRFARSLTSQEADAFRADLPHRYYEENNLHGILIAQMRPAGEVIEALDTFLPYVDNWGTCDLIRPRALRAEPSALTAAIRRWLGSTHPYTVRFAMEMLMVYCLDDLFDPAYPAWVAAVRSEEYYVHMMAAWYFATALAVRYSEILPYLTEHRLDPWTHNRTIRKACESYRLSAEQKAQLRTLRL